MSTTQKENPVNSMARAWKIIRKSINKYLQHYHYFTSISSLIALPFSLSLLLSQTPLLSLSSSAAINARFSALSSAAGFSLSSSSSLLTLKLSQTITSTLFTLPFSLSFLLLAKASIIHFLNKNNHHNQYSVKIIYTSILTTYLCTSFVIFSANASCFSLLFLASNFLHGWGWAPLVLLSVAFLLVYSIILANTIVVCNLAVISSGIDHQKKENYGFFAILKSCVLIRGRTSTALMLAVPINLGLAAVEALFQFRIVKGGEAEEREMWLVGFEGVVIAYLYSMLLVLDVIVGCLFYQSCKNGGFTEVDDEEGESCVYEVDYEKLKRLDEV